MNIALLGYGKMGQAIEKIAVKRGHTIVIKVNKEDKFTFSRVDVAIDFSVPNAALTNISNCLNNHIPVVSGTTGWLQDYNTAAELCKTKNGAFIYASNFSLGVNIFFELNKNLAHMMHTLNKYDVSIEEIHHTQKLDAPSGTAISLANTIISKHAKYQDWSLKDKNKYTIPISAKRIEDVPGTHEIKYKSEIDSINIKHIAHTRDGFALGAIVAAEWILGKKGVFTMKDVLNIG